MKEAYKYIDSYMKFMYNQWDYNMCISIFGEMLGDHIWGKWLDTRERDGIDAAITNIWWELDRDCIEKILARAFETYNIA